MSNIIKKASLIDIVDINGSESSIKAITDNFITVQKSYGNRITDTQHQNIHTLAALLYCQNRQDIKVPIIVDIPVGNGKSKLLVKFLKYMYSKDKSFSAIVVKKTIKECAESIMKTG